MRSSAVSMRQAIDKARAFPAWAPAEAIERWRYELEQLERRESALANLSQLARRRAEIACAEELQRARRVVQLLERLLSDDRMLPVWEQLATVQASGRLEISDASVFVAMVLRASRGPLREEKWTKRERKDRLRAIATHAVHLARALAGTGLEDLLRRQWSAAQCNADAARSYDPGHFSFVLLNLAVQINDPLEPGGKTCAAALYLSRARSARRQSPAAYFVAYMAKYLQEALGEAPSVRTLMSIMEVALDGPTLDERQVRRIRDAAAGGKL